MQDTMNLNVASNNGVSKHVTQNLTDLKGEVNKFKVTVGCFNISSSEIDKMCKDKISKYMENLNYIINLCDLTFMEHSIRYRRLSIFFSRTLADLNKFERASLFHLAKCSPVPSMLS